MNSLRYWFKKLIATTNGQEMTKEEWVEFTKWCIRPENSKLTSVDGGMARHPKLWDKARRAAKEGRLK